MTDPPPPRFASNDREILTLTTLVAIADDAIDEGDFDLAAQFIEWAYQTFDEHELRGEVIVQGFAGKAA